MNDDFKKVEARVAANAREKMREESRVQEERVERANRERARLEKARPLLEPVEKRLLELKKNLGRKMAISFRQHDGAIKLKIGAPYGWIQRPLFLLTITPSMGQYSVTAGDYMQRWSVDLDGVMDAVAEAVADAIAMGNVSFKFSEQAVEIYKFGTWGIATIALVAQGLFDAFGTTNTWAEEAKLAFWILLGAALWPVWVLVVAGLLIKGLFS